MGTDAAWPLQVAIIKKLKESDRLQKVFGNRARVFDMTLPEVDAPYLVVGDSRANAWHSATFDGQEHELELHLWTTEDGCNGSKAAASALIDELHNSDFPIPGHALVDLQFESSVTRFVESRQLYHCTVTFKGLTVSD